VNAQGHAMSRRSALLASPHLKWRPRNPPHPFVSANVSVPSVEMGVEQQVLSSA